MALKKSLSLLVSEIISFIKEDFNKWTYLYFILFIATIISLNYGFDLYEKYIRPTYFEGTSWWFFSLFYNTIYFLMAIPILCIRKEYAVLRKPSFYIKSILFICLFGFSIGYWGYRDWFNFENLFSVDIRYIMSAWSLFDGIIWVVCPLIFVKLLYDRKIQGLYGLAKNAQHINVYLLALFCMIPFLIGISFTDDFMNYYPRFKPWRYENAFGMPDWMLTLIYEICYASDFITTEVFFRGALVIGMTAIMGPRAVLPMVAVYASIHFGKPIMETCSSVFGGYILGILAYQTKHIWGGVIAHIGIAMTIEIMGLLHYYTNQ